MAEQHVIICKDLPAELGAFLRSLSYDKLFVLTDTNTREMCYPLLCGVPEIQGAPVITVEAGDTHKELEQVAGIWMRLSNEGASRKSLLLNVGGGMITDMGGFAAATFKRGIGSVNVPTTLMASVDAAVGGKTGINFNGLKNEIGSFYPPLCVLIDCVFLRTLDRDNLLSGYAEMIKHGLISNRETYAELLSFNLDRVDYSCLNGLVAKSVAVKQRVVAEDPYEHGIRKALNLGHTVGHAFESLSFKKERPVLHGHAVAAGLVCELYISHQVCGFPMELLSQTVYYIKEYYPAFALYDCLDYETLYELMKHDKKNESGIINFTLLAGIGDVRINQAVNKEIVLESLDFYRESFGF